MKITIARSAGFCFGVKRALTMALDAARTGHEVLMLGDIVHNEVVVDGLKDAGIKKIKQLGRGRGRSLLVRAHGAGRDVIAEARLAGYKILDATCPMVKEIHAIAKRMEDEGRTVIIIGDREHDEVRGIVGQLKKKPVIISSIADTRGRALGRVIRAGIVVQSTQEEGRAVAMADALQKTIRDVAFNNTICNPTRTKQKEAGTLPVENDVVIVVGSKSSANTKRLYQLSRRINRRTHWVNSPDGIRRSWFTGAVSVGITAGASTPESSIKEVVRRICSLKA